MSINRHKWTREQASGAARARWKSVHDGGKDRQESVSPNAKLLRRVIVEDMLVGKRHEMSFYGTKRLNCYDVLVDGKYWRTCGWSEALALVRKSCVRFGAER